MQSDLQGMKSQYEDKIYNRERQDFGDQQSIVIQDMNFQKALAEEEKNAAFEGLNTGSGVRKFYDRFSVIANKRYPGIIGNGQTSSSGGGGTLQLTGQQPSLTGVTQQQVSTGKRYKLTDLDKTWGDKFTGKRVWHDIVKDEYYEIDKTTNRLGDKIVKQETSATKKVIPTDEERVKFVKETATSQNIDEILNNLKTGDFGNTYTEGQDGTGIDKNSQRALDIQVRKMRDAIAGPMGRRYGDKNSQEGVTSKDDEQAIESELIERINANTKFTPTQKQELRDSARRVKGIKDNRSIAENKTLGALAPIISESIRNELYHPVKGIMAKIESGVTGILMNNGRLKPGAATGRTIAKDAADNTLKKIYAIPEGGTIYDTIAAQYVIGSGMMEADGTPSRPDDPRVKDAIRSLINDEVTFQTHNNIRDTFVNWAGTKIGQGVVYAGKKIISGIGTVPRSTETPYEPQSLDTPGFHWTNLD